MKYPNEVQSVVLFSQPVQDVTEIIRLFLAVEDQSSSTKYNVSECDPDAFYRLFSADDLMVTVEYNERQLQTDIFHQALGSLYTNISFPDVRNQVENHCAHILITVAHGAFGGSSEMMELLGKVNMPLPGASLAQFNRRLEVCRLMTHIAKHQGSVNAIHWAQSNQLLSGEMFENLVGKPQPMALNIHPLLVYSGNSLDGKELVGIRTYGARHFIGAELVVAPNILNWAVNAAALVAFARVCMDNNGYIVPDGDTFGSDDGSIVYRVLHHPTLDSELPLYELEPLLYREYEFQSETYIAPDRIVDDTAPPADVMPVDREARDALLADWQEKRKMAESADGGIQVSVRDALNHGHSKPGSFFQRLTGFRRK